MRDGETADWTLVLASSSPARQALLRRLCTGFEIDVPAVDETPRPGEAPTALARRLAEAKAAAVRRRRDGERRLAIIASDQVAACGERLLGKPGDASGNVEMLCSLSGRRVHFHTAVCVLAEHPDAPFEHLDQTIVTFRRLSRAEIERYVAHDQPWQCAGGFKAESAGIGLFERIESVDPTALVGLPLIRVAAILRTLGIGAIPAAP